MNVPWLLAGVLCALAALVHGIGGELTTIRPVATIRLPEVPRLELKAAWHLFTLHLAASAVLLLLLAFAVVTGGAGLVGPFLALQFLGYGVIFLALAVVRRVGPGRAPQGILLLAISGLIGWGSI